METDEMELDTIGGRKTALFVPQPLKPQFVIGHHFPDGGDVKGGKPGPVGN